MAQRKRDLHRKVLQDYLRALCKYPAGDRARRSWASSALTSCFLVAALLIGPSFAWGQQTTADVVGTVTDPSGGVIPNATVTIRNLGTGEQRTVTTTGAGDYTIPLLNPATYSLTVTSQGFQTFSAPSFTIAAGDRMRIDAHMLIGQASQTVAVTAQGTGLQTDSSMVQSLIGTETTQDLPLNGRNFMQEVQLSPGVNEGPPNTGGLASGGATDDHRQTADASVNGQSDLVNNMQLDGMDNYERLIGTVGVRPSIEAIQEMRVQTSDYTADAGRTGGGIFNVITVAGTNQFHGSAYEFFRNTVLDAYNYNFGATLPKNQLNQNQFGVSFGGPIRHNKTFFYGDYEDFRLVQGLPPTVNVVPTLFEEKNPGNFSDVGGPVIPASSFDPVGAAYFHLYPAPNKGLNTFIGSPKFVQTGLTYDLRLDHRFSDRDLFYTRFSYDNWFTTNSGSFPDSTFAGITLNPSPGAYFAPDIEYNAMLDYTHIFTTNLVMELKAGYTRIANENFPAGNSLFPNQAIGQPNVNTDVGGGCCGALMMVAVAQGANMGTHGPFSPLADQDNTFQYMGSVTYTRGAHNFSFGAGVIRRQNTYFQSSFPTGPFVFLNYPQLLTGQYINVQRSIDLFVPELRSWEPSVYAQDNWRARSWLTLNLGVRYDVFTPFTEKHNHISTFDPATGQMLIAGQNGVSPTAGIKTYYTDIGPRLGFAATIAPDTVLRGAYGISYFPMNLTSNASMKNTPFISTFGPCSIISGTCQAENASIKTFADGFPVPTANSANPLTGTVTDAVSPTFRPSMVQQINLTLQKSIGGSNVFTIGYIGVFGQHLAQLLPDLNAPPPNTLSGTAVNTLRPYHAIDPLLGEVGWFQTEGISNYNALNASLERRFTRGLAYNVNYTWAHGLDDATALSSENNQGGFGIVPSRIRQLDYSNSALDVRNRIVETVDYALPFGSHLTGWRGALGKGWQTNVIDEWTTGQPYTVVNAISQTNIEPGVANFDRPNQVASASVPKFSVNEFFNTAAFQAQQFGTLGSERRYQLYGPHFRHLDVSLFKTFPVTERANLEFRVESFNLANQANFGLPGFALNGANFGRITGMAFAYAPRELQFALKLLF